MVSTLNGSSGTPTRRPAWRNRPLPLRRSSHPPSSPQSVKATLSTLPRYAARRNRPDVFILAVLSSLRPLIIWRTSRHRLTGATNNVLQHTFDTDAIRVSRSGALIDVSPWLGWRLTQPPSINKPSFRLSNTGTPLVCFERLPTSVSEPCRFLDTSTDNRARTTRYPLRTLYAPPSRVTSPIEPSPGTLPSCTPDFTTRHPFTRTTGFAYELAANNNADPTRVLCISSTFKQLQTTFSAPRLYPVTNSSLILLIARDAQLI